MKNFLYLFTLLLIGFLAVSCDESPEDVIPPRFYEIELKPDKIYMYNPGTEDFLGVRLDPLNNDSIRVPANVTYSEPNHGIVYFLENEGSYYKPDIDFTGTDSITYTVCTSNSCKSELIVMIVEPLVDPDNCTFEINPEHTETTMNTPVEIRIFENDTFCTHRNISIWAPEKGTFNTYNYNGTYKNTIYVYYPPANYKGTDSFRYQVSNDDNTYVEVVSTIEIK